MKRLSSAIAALFVTASVAGGALAQASGRDARGTDTRADSRREAAGKNSEKDREKKGELELCKEKAHGLDGPERARFFTDCLRAPGRI